MAAPLFVYVVVIVAVGALADFNNGSPTLCYMKVRHEKPVYVMKTRTVVYRGEVKTERYWKYEQQDIYSIEATCCDGRYRLNPSGICEPVCQPSCSPPKLCVAPNSCRCPDHLVEQSDGQCIDRSCLQQKCEHGRCHPTENLCICDSGYLRKGERCEPDCGGGCGVGQVCSAPGKCTCKQGFQEGLGGCEPISCQQGYELKLNETRGARTCQPSCKSGCPHGSCTAPNTCQCDESYEPATDNDGTSTCVAKTRCWVNGYYVAPHTCRCLPGYQLRQSEEGLPMCLPNCGELCGSGAYCATRNLCKCLRGYRDVREFHEVEANATVRCEPVCSPGCGARGVCVAPGVCQCTNTFSRRQNYMCTNAWCRHPDTCQCWPQYEKTQKNPYVCKAVCEPACGNGTCVSPNRCRCLPGYELALGRCIPKCSYSCGYGNCVAPDKCGDCWEGCELATDELGRRVCAPKCTPPCVNGECKFGNRCDCWTGYRLNGSECEPVCNQPCINATCVGPDTCRCWDGYHVTLDDETKSVFVPTCNATCVNATCTAPNTCTCLEGFVRDSGDPSRATCGLPCPDHMCVEEARGKDGCLMAADDHHGCVCATGVRRGSCGVGEVCSAAGKCTCKQGFQEGLGGCEPISCPQGYELKVNGTQGPRTCQPSCKSGCPHGSCTAPDTCQCDEGYQPATDKDGASSCVAMPRCWINGYYAAPNICRCLPGYQLGQSEEGLPMCLPDCGELCRPGAYCAAPNECKCLPGYRDYRTRSEIRAKAPVLCRPS